MPSQVQVQRKSHWLTDILLLSLLLFLFWEWLRPLPAITDTHSLPVFLLFFVFILTLRMIHFPWYLNGLLISLVLFYALYYLYFFGSFFSKKWLLALGESIAYSISLILRWDIANLPPESKTLFFLMFIWYIAYFLFEHRFRKRSMFIFFLFTIVYLATLDTFTPYQAQWAIIRTILCGFLLLALMQLHTIRKSGPVPIKGKGKTATIWMISSIVMVMFVSALGILAPKAGPSWPDPVSFLHAYTNGAFPGGAGAGVQKVGYGNSDEELGGGFVQDDSVAFYALTTERHYWRGESKDYYNGRGWEHSDRRELYLIPPQAEPASLQGHPGSLFEDGLPTDRVHARVFMTETPFSTLFYPGDIRTLDVYPKDTYLQLDSVSGRFTSWADDLFSERKGMEEYILESDYPRFSVSSLKEADMSLVSEEIQRRYTQLPDELPQRIGELAHELTVSLDNPYDKVKEIESYFRREGYRYETQDVPIPEPGEDYVDQFIFETKRGYCDNFSSAMVVMLRTIDIPARWVKGFTAGEVLERNDDFMYTMVRNRNAHSWVEVYFPGTGWVPFEPTRSFVSPYTFERDVEAENIGVDQAEREQEEAESPVEEEDALEEREEKRENRLDGAMGLPSFTNDLGKGINWKYVFWFFFALAIVLLALFLWRYTILAWLVSRYKQNSSNESIIKGYERLISYMGMVVLKRRPSQTMREYVDAIESKFEKRELQDFTRMFEEVRYGRKKDS